MPGPFRHHPHPAQHAHDSMLGPLTLTHACIRQVTTSPIQSRLITENGETATKWRWSLQRFGESTMGIGEEEGTSGILKYIHFWKMMENANIDLCIKWNSVA